MGGIDERPVVARDRIQEMKKKIRSESGEVSTGIVDWGPVVRKT